MVHLLLFNNFFDKVYRFRVIVAKVVDTIIIIIILLGLSPLNRWINFIESYIKRRGLAWNFYTCPHVVWNSDVLGVKTPKNPIFWPVLGGIFPLSTGHNFQPISLIFGYIVDIDQLTSGKIWIFDLGLLSREIDLRVQEVGKFATFWIAHNFFIWSRIAKFKLFFW